MIESEAGDCIGFDRAGKLIELTRGSLPISGGSIKMDKCGICGKPKEDDLFSAVTGEIVCTICKIKFVGGLPTTPQKVSEIREKMGLAPGDYLKQNNAEEARKILGR